MIFYSFGNRGKAILHIPGATVADIGPRDRSVDDVGAEEVGGVHADHLGLLVGALRGVGGHGAAVHVVVVIEAMPCRAEEKLSIELGWSNWILWQSCI